MKKLNLLIVLAIVYFLGGCQSSQTTNEQTDMRINDIWVLQTLNGQDVKKEKAGKQMPYLEFHLNNNMVLGNTGCNELNGEAVVSGNKIKFGSISATKMNCNDATYEIDFREALSPGTVEYSIENLKLTITKNGKVIMTFKKVD
jgi:heat shock protein HslJ